MKNIVFVCTGGSCRSPMAEAILADKLKKLKIKNYNITSAGINANIDAKIEKNAVLALKHLGIKAPKHRCLQLTKDLCENALIIAISKAHKDFLNNVQNVVALSDFYSGIDIPDPFGKDVNTYIKTAKILDFILNEIVDNIKEGKIW